MVNEKRQYLMQVAKLESETTQQKWVWGSHEGNYEELSLLRCNAMQFGDGKTFRRNISPTLRAQLAS
jgi:hypothetical protein